MSHCCAAAGGRKSSLWAGRIRESLAWVLPSALLIVAPKCPACLAAYVVLWTGIGLSLAAAAYLRWLLLFLCVASLFFLMVRRLGRPGTILSYFRKETEPCNTK
jgi:hypothetical protein